MRKNTHSTALFQSYKCAFINCCLLKYKIEIESYLVKMHQDAV